MSATNRGSERLDRDKYQTPEPAVQAVLPFFAWPHISSVLEPCRGDGNIWHLIPTGPKRYWCEIEEGRDYLKYRPRREFDLILTNPPYSLAVEFLMKSLAEAKTVSYLVRLNFLGSIDRYEILNDNRPDYQWTLAPRPRFYGGGSDATEYAWVIWDRGGLVVPGTPRFQVIGLEESESTKTPIPSPGLILPPSMRPPPRVEVAGTRRVRRKAA